jgi:hypothetical protein
VLFFLLLLLLLLHLWPADPGVVFQRAVVAHGPLSALI